MYIVHNIEWPTGIQYGSVGRIDQHRHSHRVVNDKTPEISIFSGDLESCEDFAAALNAANAARKNTMTKKNTVEA